MNLTQFQEMTKVQQQNVIDSVLFIAAETNEEVSARLTSAANVLISASKEQ
jgi:hypothetical protein